MPELKNIFVSDILETLGGMGINANMVLPLFFEEKFWFSFYHGREIGMAQEIRPREGTFSIVTMVGNEERDITPEQMSIDDLNEVLIHLETFDIVKHNGRL